MPFSIFDHVQFNKTGRAICPSCLLTKGEGYRKYNLSVSLDPADHGAYKCHRGCTTEQIREAIGDAKPLEKTYIPTAKPQKEIVYQTDENIESSSRLLRGKTSKTAPKALQYLLDRGLELRTIEYFKIGYTFKNFKYGEEWKPTPCLFIPYEIEAGKWLGKYFPNKWLPEEDRPDQPMSQPNVTARWYFTHQPDGKELWICEGEWDALLLGQKLYNEQSNISVATATCGAGGIPKDLSPLDQYDRIVIFYDLDYPDNKGRRAGQDGAKKLAEAIGDRAFVATVPAPENPKNGYDITDGFKEFGDQYLEMLIKASKTENTIDVVSEEITEAAQSATQETEQEIIHLDRYDPDEPPISEHFNQIAQKKLFSDKHWVCINDTLHYWTGTHYEVSPDPVEKRRISEFCNKFLVYDDRTNKRTYKYANEQSVNAVMKWVKVGFGVDPTTVNPTGLNLANGVLTIEWEGKTPTWKLKNHHPNMVYTYCSKVRYDPKADPETCDRLLIALDDAQRDVFLKTIAASFDLANVRKVMPDRLRGLLLQGDGSNGKDTLREAIAEIFSRGITGCSLRDFQQYDEGKKFPLAKLEYSRINWASENHSRLSLDSLQSLKNVLTGDPIDIERKNVDDYDIKPACIVLLNCNEAPSIVGAQKAIESRYAIVKFAKTFTSDPQSPDELPADPRFKNDPEFLQNQVCPSLLNRLLDALVRLMQDGIDYKPLAGAIQEAKEASCHLIRWATDIKLEQGDGCIKIGDLYESLKSWYVDQGILDIETTDKGKERLDWLDDGNRFDPWIKAPRLMKQGLTKIFPRARFSQRTKHGFLVYGIQSINFAISHDFDSFDSPEEKNQDIESISTDEPKGEPNLFDSFLVNQINNTANNLAGEPKSMGEPNYFDGEAKKTDNHAISEPMNQGEPNLCVTNNYLQKKSFKQGDRPEIGDRVEVVKGFFVGATGTITARMGLKYFVECPKWVQGNHFSRDEIRVI
ncbi:DUF5906 domain-containing protein [Pseudanabaena yagii]|uniref:SF3 helicase domain-containing protein n=1 Tax=Pseudanabaena yagii GIHE-NHR1 TaxID=2722753 RepID=A0ABX1LXE7_9CYAN|nr:DUF5906 domain-containing protein [Pseudanabaena yagii]NMF60156.1 hypothetical protein [Pseudanabaena yagii GIHE-NHR1]